MSTVAQLVAGLSLTVFTVASLIGFVDAKDKNDPFNKLKRYVNSTLKWKWLDKPYILTRIGLIIAWLLGVVVIVLS